MPAMTTNTQPLSGVAADRRALVDTHHHLWQLDALEYGWLRDRGTAKPFGDPTPIQRDYLIAEYLKDCASMGVCKSVHVQADGGLPDPVLETAWLQAIADRWGFPHAIVGFADLRQRSVAQTLARHCCHANVRGIRQILSRHPDPRRSFTQQDLLADTQWRRGFSLLKDFGLSFELQLYPHQMAEAARFLAGQPDVAVVVSHAGSPWDRSPEGLRAWKASLAHLAALEQVEIKISGIGMFDPGLEKGGVRWNIDTILELFGSHRVMLGSNFPVDSLYAGYEAVMDLYQQQLSGLSASEQDDIWCRNAERFYRI